MDRSADPPSLLDLYALTYAPIRSDSVLDEVKDLEASDLHLGFVTDELKYVADLAGFGLKSFHELLELSKQSGDDLSAGVGLVALCAFIKRMQNLLGCLGDAADVAGSTYEGALPTLKEFEASVKRGNKPSCAQVADLVNLTPNMKWDNPVAVQAAQAANTDKDKGKVGFKNKAVIFGGGGNVQTEDAVKDEPAAKPAGVRSQRRHPTGYAKFTFKPEDLDLDESDDGGSTGVSRSRVDSDDQSRSVASTGGNQSRMSANDDEDLGDMNPFSTGKRSSSVGFTNEAVPVVEQDTNADPNWDDEKRHEKRYSRIRERIPTGHPKIMKANSDELAAALESYEKKIPGMGDDKETLDNTTANSGPGMDVGSEGTSEDEKEPRQEKRSGGVRF